MDSNNSVITNTLYCYDDMNSAGGEILLKCCFKGDLSYAAKRG